MTAPSRAGRIALDLGRSWHLHHSTLEVLAALADPLDPPPPQDHRQLPIAARIVQVVDLYCWWTSPGNPSRLPPREAAELLGDAARADRVCDHCVQLLLGAVRLEAPQ